MIALVLSGGGNKGALQVGAVQALFESGVRPDMVVGTSIGAINAIHLATSPTLEGVANLKKLWCSVRREDVYCGNLLTTVWRLAAHQKSIFSNEAWLRFVRTHLPIRMLADALPTRLYIVATTLNMGQLRVFGPENHEFVLDAAMASTAVPPFFPPWAIHGIFYVDGGVASNLPIQIAMEKGATEIYALHVASPLYGEEDFLDVFAIANRSVLAIMEQQSLADVRLLTKAQAVKFHYIRLEYSPDLPFDDFGHADRMFAYGYNVAKLALRQSNSQTVSWRQNLGRSLQRQLENLAASAAIFFS